LDRSFTYRRHLESLRKKLTSRVGLLGRLAGSGWDAGATTMRNSHPSPHAFNRRILCSCLVPQCSYPPHRPHHQRRLANCDWLYASYTSAQLSHPRRHPACELRRNGAMLSLSRRAMDPGHLLHSELTHPSSADARLFKSRCLFVPAAKQLISLSDNSMRAAHWADHQWNAE